MMAPSQHEHIDDEMLVAFLNCELSSKQSAYIEQAINDDEQLAARADNLMQVDEPLVELISQAHQKILREPVPSRLSAAVWQTTSTGARTEVMKLPARQRFTGYVPMAIAASVTLVIGSLLGQQFAEQGIDSRSLTQADAGIIIAPTPLYVALEQTPSQQPFVAGNGDIILPVMTFQVNDGRYCREFQINTDSKVSVGVACKQKDYWNMEILLAADSRPVDSKSYQPASGYSQVALDAVLDGLWNGVAFDQAAEKELIQQAWR
ncbi:MAG: hypothetical protein L3J89_06615 [Gammaproteobacteria bacterium]|nr:hypothetical protein [Gammaproteobacteria bacterium]